MVALAGALFVVGLAVGRYLRPRPAAKAAAVATVPAETPAAADTRAESRSTAPAPSADQPPVAAETRPVYLALVIDDLGRSLDEVDQLTGLGVDLTYAVLPFERRTPEVVAALHRRGSEVLVHLPMEPDGSANPGPGALRRDMSSAELERRTRAALDAVAGAVGVNNHMGSALSADPAAMRTILGTIAGRGLFFLDSRTSAESVAFDVARSLGIAATTRQVFLDGDLEPAAIRRQFQRFLAVATEKGAAVAIGHPHPETLEVLREEVSRARREGYRFVPVSWLLERSGNETSDS